MNYNKKIWSNGDLITQESMNNIENGIYIAHDEIDKINPKTEENTSNINQARTDIDKIKKDLGTDELATTDKTLKGGINELSSQIKEIVNSGGNIGTNEISKLKNKKILAIGDSITDKTTPQTKYITFIEENTGCIVTNEGKSGGGYVNGTSLVSRVDSFSEDFDLIYVLLGINDYMNNGGVEIGDASSTDTSTFYGAVDYCFNKLVEKYYDKTILIFTPLQKQNCTSANSKGYTLNDYCQVIRETAEKYSLHLYDLYKYSGFYCNNSNFITNYTYNGDGIHPTSEWHKNVLAPLITKIFNFVIIDNNENEIIVSQSQLSVDEGESASFTVKLLNSISLDTVVNIEIDNNYCTVDKSNLTFTSSNYNVPQTVTISSIADTSSYNDKTSVVTISSSNLTTQSVTVTIINNDINENPENIPVESVSLDKTSYTLEVGGTVQLTTTILPSNATNTNTVWSTDNSNCTVENGLVTAVSEGTCVITVTTEDGNKTASCTITVNNASTSTDLFNRSTIKENTYVDTSGVEKTLNGYYCTDYISVIPGERLEIESIDVLIHGAYYDSDKNFVSSVPGSTRVTEASVITIPEGVSYVRMNNENAHLNTYYIKALDR